MLKGKATIELTNVKTGEVEVYEEENMVTNAVQDILTLNPRGLGYKGYTFAAPTSETATATQSFQSHCLPICPNLMGGVLLYQNELEEDPDKYYAPMDNPLIGYSSNDVNTTTDPKRGSMNQTESKSLSNGYKFVFDFSTSQGNGTISSLGLTSKWGGRYGYGHTLDRYKQHILSLNTQTNTTTNSYLSDQSLLRQASIVSLDVEKEIGIFVRVIDTNTIELGRILTPIETINLSDSQWGKLRNINNDIHTITTTQFASTLTNNYFYGTFIDGRDDYIWGFQHLNNANGNSSGDATILWIKINKKDFSFEEGSWTIGAQFYRFGEYYVLRQDNNYPSGWNYAIIKDQILYAIKYTSNSNMSGVYAIPLNDPSSIRLLTFTDNSTQALQPSSNNGNEYFYQGTAVNEINNVIVYRGGYIHNGKLYPQYNTSTCYFNSIPSPEALASCPKPGLKYGPFLFSFNTYYYSYNNYRYWQTQIYLMTTYLATINNLETPIEKTEDKTMKITYILTEVEDDEEI